jgi:predicted DNA-binding transcriptional regulator AlpA
MQTNLPQDRLALRPRECAKCIGISERSLWTLTKANEVPHTRLGKSVLYPVDALRRHGWLEAEAVAQ